MTSNIDNLNDTFANTLFERVLRKISAEACDALITCSVRDLSDYLRLTDSMLDAVGVKRNVITELIVLQQIVNEEITYREGTLENSSHYHSPIKQNDAQIVTPGPGAVSAISIPVDFLSALSTRALNVLRQNRVLTCEKLLSYSEPELYRLPNSGTKTVNELLLLMARILQRYPVMEALNINNLPQIRPIGSGRPFFYLMHIDSRNRNVPRASDPSHWSLLTRSLSDIFIPVGFNNYSMSDHELFTIDDLALPLPDIMQLRSIALLPTDPAEYLFFVSLQYLLQASISENSLAIILDRLAQLSDLPHISNWEVPSDVLSDIAIFADCPTENILNFRVPHLHEDISLVMNKGAGQVIRWHDVAALSEKSIIECMGFTMRALKAVQYAWKMKNEAIERNEAFDEGLPKDSYASFDQLVDSLVDTATRDEREQVVLKGRLGLLEGRGWTLEELGNRLGVTRERIRQIAAKRMDILKIKCSAGALNRLWLTTTEILNECGGVCRASEVAQHWGKLWGWDSLPSDEELASLLSIERKFDIERSYSILIIALDHPCIKCKEIGDALTESVVNKGDGILSFDDAAATMHSFCNKQNCSIETGIPQFSKGFMRYVEDQHTETRKGPVPEFEKPERVKIGAVLKKHLAERGITHYSIAKMLGKSRQYVHGILNGDYSCTMAAYRRIIDVMGLELNDILAKVEAMKGEGEEVRTALSDRVRMRGECRQALKLDIDRDQLTSSTTITLHSIYEPADPADVALFRSVLLSSFPRGFSFIPSSESLLVSAAGKVMSEGVKHALMGQMLRCEEGSRWLLPEMVVDDAVLTQVLSRADTYIQDFGFFSLDVIRDEFKHVLRNLPNVEADFYNFFLIAVAPKLGRDICVTDSKTIRLCHKSGQTIARVNKHAAERIFQVLQNAGDAVSVDSLGDLLPFLSVTNINAMIKMMIPSAVSLTVDGVDFWKLIDFFYLPEDMNEQIVSIVNRLEDEGSSPSAVLIESGFNQVYGGNFCENFAVPDMSTFQQIVSASYHGAEARVWKNRVFRREADNIRNNVLDDFLQTQAGIFYESEFFDFAKRTRGLTCQGILILTFLRTACIRLDRDRWISNKDFQEAVVISHDDVESIVTRLNESLGNQAFLPLGTLPNSFFENLPDLSLYGNIYPWNAYLLTSFCCHNIPSLRVVNDEPSPYTVTAMLIPADADFAGDVIDYVLKVYMASGVVGRTALETFEYLKQQQVRITKTKKLMARIQSLFGVV